MLAVPGGRLVPLPELAVEVSAIDTEALGPPVEAPVLSLFAKVRVAVFDPSVKLSFASVIVLVAVPLPELILKLPVRAPEVISKS